MNNNKYIKLNNRIFSLLSVYLNFYADFIKKEMIEDITNLGLSERDAFKLLLANTLDLDIIDNNVDKELYNEYFDLMVDNLNVNEYKENLYYKNIKFNYQKIDDCELKYDVYEPYEGFVFDDIKRYINGKQVPCIGFFSERFTYPAIYENDRLWMSITPNEINTMKEPIEKASGKVLAFGLGLGYFAYMVSEKEQVTEVVVVEKNLKIIELFENYILPQMKNKEKIKIINDDAYSYAENKMGKENFSFIYTDLWHDVSDGIPLYKKMKEMEKYSPQSNFMYWIEKSMLCYL